MTSMTLTFDAVNEPMPGAKWQARWHRSWPAYEAWFISRGGDGGPSAVASRDALQKHMPELVETYDALVKLAGGSDRAAKFLSTWCPPTYLGGCSLAAQADEGDVRLVRNYDLSPELNEGLLLRTEWTGRSVMGMIEFLWGLSDGINDAGLSIALAYGGRTETAEGFGITTILRYVLETCSTAAETVAALSRIPSHMAYNIVVADRAGHTVSVEMTPGGGAKIMPRAIATNHQSQPTVAARPAFTQTFERHAHLSQMTVQTGALNAQFLKPPLLQNRYSEGFGTLFTAEYTCVTRSLGLTICGERWDQSLKDFQEGQRIANYALLSQSTTDTGEQYTAPSWTADGHDWRKAAQINWQKVASDYSNGCGKPICHYLSEVA